MEEPPAGSLGALYDLYRGDKNLPIEIRRALAGWVTSRDKRPHIPAGSCGGPDPKRGAM
jgi:hypothetical protein